MAEFEVNILLPICIRLEAESEEEALRKGFFEASNVICEWPHSVGFPQEMSITEISSQKEEITCQ